MLRKQECQLHRSASRPAGLQLGGVAARPPAETLPCSNQHPGAEGTVGQAAHSLGLRLSGSAMGALYKRSIRLLLWPRTGERIWEAEVPGLGMRSGLLSHRILSPPLIEPHPLHIASVWPAGLTSLRAMPLSTGSVTLFTPMELLGWELGYFTVKRLSGTILVLRPRSDFLSLPPETLGSLGKAHRDHGRMFL